ncbi:MAG TPA: HNH endonuclease [Clostridiaceae bacterium]
MTKSSIVLSVCIALNEGDKVKCKKIINDNYPFKYKETKCRSYTKIKLTRVFIRNGFIDRYSGEKLVFPGTLMILSKELPIEFPYQKNWKMTECHIAYWHMYPTADHITPIARGGTNDEDNLVTTSMLRNSSKSNFTLEELGWKLYPQGDIKEWDGLIKWFIDYVDKHNTLLEDNYIKEWYRAAIKNL